MSKMGIREAFIEYWKPYTLVLTDYFLLFLLVLTVPNGAFWIGFRILCGVGAVAIFVLKIPTFVEMWKRMGMLAYLVLFMLLPSAVILASFLIAALLV